MPASFFSLFLTAVVEKSPECDCEIRSRPGRGDDCVFVLGESPSGWWWRLPAFLGETGGVVELAEVTAEVGPVTVLAPIALGGKTGSGGRMGDFIFGEDFARLRENSPELTSASLRGDRPASIWSSEMLSPSADNGEKSGEMFGGEMDWPCCEPERSVAEELVGDVEDEAVVRHRSIESRPSRCSVFDLPLRVPICCVVLEARFGGSALGASKGEEKVKS